MNVNGGATVEMKPLLGNYYQYDGTPILKAMYREMKECIYVEKDEGIVPDSDIPEKSSGDHDDSADSDDDNPDDAILKAGIEAPKL
ncbi:hypothetical protein AgCh_018641 [Apium graveolens]